MAILTIALGGAVVLGAIGSAVFSTVAAASVHTETQTVDVAGVTGLNVSVDAASLRVEFADVLGGDPRGHERSGRRRLDSAAQR